jgi:hypothetical protein
VLLCRGWRRCGNLVYLPIHASCCCPQYAIRLEASRFAPSKAQRRVLSRFQRFLDGSFHPHVPSSSPSCTRTSRQNPPHRTSDRTEGPLERATSPPTDCIDVPALSFNLITQRFELRSALALMPLLHKPTSANTPLA